MKLFTEMTVEQFEALRSSTRAMLVINISSAMRNKNQTGCKCKSALEDRCVFGASSGYCIS